MNNDASLIPPVLLVHGAWAGPWVWRRLLPFLWKSGLQVMTVDLRPGPDGPSPANFSLQVHLDRVERALDTLGGRATLVGHSGGGVTISAAAEAWPDRVAGLAYVAGMMLPSRMGFGDLLASMDAAAQGLAGIGPHLDWNAARDQSRVPEAAARELFFQCAPPALARKAAAGLTAQPEGGRTLRAVLTDARYGSVSRLYVKALRDRAVCPQVQDRMIALCPGAEVVALDCDHAPMLSAPEALATALTPFLLAPGAVVPA